MIEQQNNSPRAIDARASRVRASDGLLLEIQESGHVTLKSNFDHSKSN